MLGTPILAKCVFALLCGNERHAESRQLKRHKLSQKRPVLQRSRNIAIAVSSMSGTDDFCEIVEKATNSHQDRHHHEEDMKEDDDSNDSSNVQGQQGPSNPFANFAFGGGAVLVATEPSGAKRKELKGGGTGKKARARKFEGLNFARKSAILNRCVELCDERG